MKIVENTTKPQHRKTQVVAVMVLISLLLFSMYALVAVGHELERNSQQTLVSDITSQSDAFSRELNTVLSELETFAGLFQAGELDSSQMNIFQLTRQTQAKDVGIMGLDGSSILGKYGDITAHSVLEKAATGQASLGYVTDFYGASGVLFAVPVYVTGVQKYVLYELKLSEHMTWLNRSISSGENSFVAQSFEEEDLSSLLDDKGQPIFPFQGGEFIGEAEIYAQSKVNWANEQLKMLQFLDKNPGEIYVDKIGIAGESYTITAMDFTMDGFTSVRLTPPSNDGQAVAALLVQCVVALFALVLAALSVAYYARRSDKLYQEKMFKTAYKDQLTNNYNWDWMQAYMVSLGDEVMKKTLVLINVKDFRTINQLYGRDHGDLVLQEIGRTLENQEWADMAARRDSDSFLLLVEQRNFEELKSKLNYIFRNLRKISKDTNTMYFRCGVVDIKSPLSEVNCFHLLDECSAAIRTANTPKKTEVVQFSQSMREKERKDQRLREDFPEAMAKGEFEVFFQPKYELVHETLAGAEALIRWKYKGENYLSPGMFIPLFEQDGSVKEIDRFVFYTVCQQFAIWKKKGLPLYPVSVNLSRVQMDNENIVSELADLADKFEVDKRLIQIEITESGEFQDLELLVQSMHDLKNAGFALAMDDFGTGYSSFSMLTDMPLEVLKIDKSFVDKIQDHRGQMIIGDIITMAKHLDIACLAEGVEEEYQRDLLRQFGCDYIQGYFYAKPMQILDYEALLKQ